VIGFSQLMQSEAHGPVGHDRYREYAGHIAESGQRLLAATEDAIAVTDLLSRSPRKTLQPFSFTAVQRALASATTELRLSSSDCVGSAKPLALAAEDDIVRAIEKAVGLIRRDRPLITSCDLTTFEQAGFVWLAVTLSNPADEEGTASGAGHTAVAGAYPAVEDDFEFCLTRTLLETMDITMVRHVSDDAVVLKFGCQIDAQPELPL
ncbi:MAG: hypothetical protein AAGJ53_06875, partial [Pseudomonadota bacterium]